jgi:DNA repair exonuclease SbcCD ATPase subunit
MSVDFAAQINQLNADYSSLVTKRDQLTGRLSTIQEQFQSSTTELTKVRDKHETCTYAAKVISRVQNSVQDLLKKAIEAPATKALQHVWSKDHEFHLQFDARGNTQECQPYITSKDIPEPIDPADGESGGKIDVCNLVLRTMMLELLHPAMECPLILDEPFKHCSSPNPLAKCEEFLQELQKQSGRQIIVASPNTPFSREDKNVITVGVTDDSE